MGRRSSKEVRYSTLNQWQLKKLRKKKKNAKQDDLKDWTDNVLKKISKDDEE